MKFADLQARVRALLAQEDDAAVARLAVERRRVLSVLVALTYDDDPLLADRAIIAFGSAAGAVSDVDAEFVRGHLRRLLWLLSDESGGICWRGPELLAEAIRARPERFAAFRPPLESLLEGEPKDAARFRASWERGMARLAEGMEHKSD